MDPPSGEASLAHAVAALREHEHCEAIASAVAEALLERAAERRFDPEPGVAGRAAERAGLEDEKARRTALGDPLALLDREPGSPVDVALLEAALGIGLAKRLGEAEGDGRRREVRALLGRLDWLEAHTAVSPYAGVSAALSGELSDLFWDEVASALVDEVRAEPPAVPTEARRRELLLSTRAAALAWAPEETRAALAGRTVSGLQGGPVKRVALASLAGVDDAEAEASREAGRDPSAAVRAAAASRAPKLEGALEERRWGPVKRLLAALTGILLLRWLVRLAIRHLLRYRREGVMTLGASSLKVEHRMHLLGRVVRTGESSHSLRSVHSREIEVRYPSIHLLVGALALVLGAGIGANFVVEGSWAGYPPLVLFGIAVVAGGLALDILLEVLVPAKAGVCSVTVDLGRHAIRLRGVDEARAREFAAALDQLLPSPSRRP